MKPNYLVHEDIYIAAKEAGWNGWGGNQGLADAKLVSRFMALKERPSKGKLLELGCGEGHHCRTFTKLGYETTGVDISSTAIEWAKEKAVLTGIKSRFFVADLTEMSLTLTDKYQVIIDGNCLHCIIGNDRSTFLNHTYKALESDGIFFVSSLCSKDNDNHQILRDGIPYRHITSMENLITELKNIGFIILKTVLYERQDYNHITIHVRKPSEI
ncbi:class I SAM-dependent methyltransferase [Marinomonas transparens]|uniref:Class I SAM-dependent methyltransferase n=1 Tax=Marinomonas transparens TaxID=2795388 RepID=A0A934JT24_9GAMM|nr:class I SAM-dependent methyltransferase [Marinomonas transparens]MBJ7536855.1 class I SAM-dependent methyltransferase [Marinomonas transparens]